MKELLKSIHWQDHLVQIVFVFSSVLFAFWLSDRSQNNSIKETEMIAIRSIYAEMQSNLEGLKIAQAYHEEKMLKMVEVISALDDGDIVKNKWDTRYLMDSVFNRQANALGTHQLKDAAYRTFEKTEAYLQVNYNLAAKLSQTYQHQNENVKQTSKLFTSEIPSLPEFYKYQETSSMIVLCFFTLRELSGQEISLITNLEIALDAVNLYYPELKLSKAKAD